MNKPIDQSQFQTPDITLGALPSSSKVYTAPDADPSLRVPHRLVHLHESANEPDVKPEDNGGAKGKHLAREFPIKNQPLKGRDGEMITQYEFACAGIITPLSSRRNLCATRLPRAAPLCPPISTTPSLSRKSLAATSL